MLKNTEGAINNGQSREEKLATQCHQDEEKQNKNTIQYVLDTSMNKQTQIILIRHEPSYKQLKRGGVMTN